MTDRDDLLRRVRRANPAPAEGALPAEIANSRPPLAWLIEKEQAVSDATPPGARRRWRGPAIAVAALVAALAVALPLWFVFRGEETPPVVTEPTLVTTTMLGSTTTIPAGTTTTTAAASATTWTVPAGVVDLGSPDRLADFQAGPLPAAATCPAGSTPDVPGGDTWWWSRPGGETIRVTQAAFDWESGRLVAGFFVDRIWLLDPCRNLWEGRVGGPPVYGPLVYDADSDLVLFFAGDGVWAYDTDADTWTQKGGMPDTSDWSFQAVYHDPSGLVVGVSGFGSARHLWAYDVEPDTWYDLGPVNLGEIHPYDPVMLGYDPVGDRFYIYVAGAGGGAQTWRYEPGQGWTYVATLTPDFDLSRNDSAYPAGTMAFDRSAGRFVIMDRGVVAALDPSVPEWEIIFDQSDGGSLNRSYQAVVYDPLNGRLIVLGGRYGEGEWANDVWAFDTRTREWSELLPPIVGWEGIVPVPSIPGDAAGWGPLTAVSASEVWAAGRADIGHLDDGVWTPYRLAEDGQVGGLAVAADGTVWAPTGLGVFSFDGVEWTQRFDYPAYEVAVAPDGAVWITADGSQRLGETEVGVWLGRWDGGSFVPIDPDSQGPARVAVTRCPPQLAVAADGRVWVTDVGVWCSTTVLIRYDGAAWEEVPIADYPAEDVDIYAMEAAPNGDLWITGSIQTDERQLPLLARFDGEAWTTYDFSEPPDIAVGPDGRVWFSSGDGLASFDGTDWTYHIQGQRVSGVDVAPDGTVWYSDEDGVHTLGTP